jgi:hypothetical protein
MEVTCLELILKRCKECTFGIPFPIGYSPYPSYPRIQINCPRYEKVQFKLIKGNSDDKTRLFKSKEEINA